MKALVIYDTLHGNTEKIARAIGAGLAGATGASAGIEVVKAGDVQPDQLTGIDLLLVGAPTHGSQPSPAMHEFLNRIPNGDLAGVKVAAFDTRTDAVDSIHRWRAPTLRCVVTCSLETFLGRWRGNRPEDAGHGDAARDVKWSKLTGFWE